MTTCDGGDGGGGGYKEETGLGLDRKEVYDRLNVTIRCVAHEQHRAFLNCPMCADYQGCEQLTEDQRGELEASPFFRRVPVGKWIPVKCYRRPGGCGGSKNNDEKKKRSDGMENDSGVDGVAKKRRKQVKEEWKGMANAAMFIGVDSDGNIRRLDPEKLAVISGLAPIMGAVEDDGLGIVEIGGAEESLYLKDVVEIYAADKVLERKTVWVRERK